ncbi:MAG: hypothetical protein ABSG56_04985 [Bryobacteraceae bacterium]|jgi:hypothetical protein
MMPAIKRSPTDSCKEKEDLVNRGNMMCRAQPFEHLNVENERRQPARSPQAAIRPADFKFVS